MGERDMVIAMIDEDFRSATLPRLKTCRRRSQPFPCSLLAASFLVPFDCGVGTLCVGGYCVRLQYIKRRALCIVSLPSWTSRRALLLARRHASAQIHDACTHARTCPAVESWRPLAGRRRCPSFRAPPPPPHRTGLLPSVPHGWSSRSPAHRRRRAHTAGPAHPAGGSESSRTPVARRERPYLPRRDAAPLRETATVRRAAPALLARGCREREEVHYTHTQGLPDSVYLSIRHVPPHVGMRVSVSGRVGARYLLSRAC